MEAFDDFNLNTLGQFEEMNLLLLPPSFTISVWFHP
jgi:hypothetical protein